MYKVYIIISLFSKELRIHLYKYFCLKHIWYIHVLLWKTCNSFMSLLTYYICVAINVIWHFMLIKIMWCDVMLCYLLNFGILLVIRNLYFTKTKKFYINMHVHLNCIVLKFEFLFYILLFILVEEIINNIKLVVILLVA